MRLDKFLADSTRYSRNDIKKFARDGAITVNGVTAKKTNAAVSETDTVTLNGAVIEYTRYVYLILNKPQGCVSAVYDRRYPVVTDFVPEKYRHYSVSPAGRLDIDTEGLLILTNDGLFCHNIISPKNNVFKRYFARLDRPAQERDIEVFAAGMDLGDFAAKPAKLEITVDPREVHIEIAEGKFHQVKRMCARVGKNVTYLKRTAIGGLELPPELEAGGVIEMSRDALLSAIGIA